MKILVCISKTPDTTSSIDFIADNKEFKTDGVQFINNPYDEWYSLVRAVEIKEANPETEVHIVNVGTHDNDAVIRKALAIGGNKAYRIHTNPKDSYSIAKAIADFVETIGAYDIIFTGKESIDYNSGIVGGILAELLSLPYFANISQLDMVSDDEIKIKREIEGGHQIIQGKLPVVLSSQKGLAEQRIPNMKGIISSRSKPIDIIEPKNFQGKTEITSFEKLSVKQNVKLIDADNVDELVRLLHEEAKVI